MTLSTCSRPVDRLVGAGGQLARCSVRAAAFQRMSSTSELLPEPETPVTAVTTPSGKRTSTFWRLCCRAPLTTIAGHVRVGRPAGGWSARGSPPCPRGTCRSATSSDARTFAGAPDGRDPAARLARAGAEVDEVVGRLDHLAVVLDEDQRVAQVAEVLQGARAAGRCRAGAGRSSARRARRGRPSGRCRSGWPGGSAGSRRRRASACRGPGSGSRGRRRPGTSGGRGPRGRGRRRCAARPRPAAGP